MAIRNLVFSDENFIRKTSRPIVDFDEKLWELLDDMKETMIKNEGCGLAAPQVGVLKRAVIVEACGMFIELINPIIIKQSGTQEGVEGCLSVKDVNGVVERPLKITIKAQNRYGDNFTMTVENFTSVVFCHEIDHLDGVLFIDKAKKIIKKELVTKNFESEKVN